MKKKSNFRLPDGYELAKSVDPKIVNQRGYRQWTVLDLIEIVHDYPLDTPVFISEYDAEADEILVRPFEGAGGKTSGFGNKPGYLVLH